LNVIEETFDDPAPLTLNKIRNWTLGSTRNYYPRPTPLIFNIKKEAVLQPPNLMASQSINGILMASQNMKSLAPYKK